MSKLQTTGFSRVVFQFQPTSQPRGSRHHRLKTGVSGSGQLYRVLSVAARTTRVPLEVSPFQRSGLNCVRPNSLVPTLLTRICLARASSAVAPPMPDSEIVIPLYSNSDLAVAAVRELVRRVVAYRVDVTEFFGYLVGERAEVPHVLSVIARPSAGCCDVSHEVAPFPSTLPLSSGGRCWLSPKIGRCNRTSTPSRHRPGYRDLNLRKPVSKSWVNHLKEVVLFR